MEQFIELCHQDDHFFCFFLSEYFTIPHILNSWSLTNKKTRQLIFKSDFFWKRKIQHELPFGALDKIEKWRRGEYWSDENEELFNRTTANKLRGKLNGAPNDDIEKAIKRALFTSKSDISALMICIYLNHAFYDMNFGKCFGVRSVSEFYIFFQFFYRFIKSKETNRVLRYIDGVEDNVARNFRTLHLHSILFNSNNPLTSYLEFCLGSVQTVDDENFKFFPYNYEFELVNEQHLSEQSVFYPFLKRVDNREQVGCFVCPYYSAYPCLKIACASELYFPKDYSKFLDELELSMEILLYRNSIV